MDVIELIKEISKKTKKYWLIVIIVGIICTMLIWYFLPKISYNIPKVKNTDLILRIFFSFFIWGFCFTIIFFHKFFRKNRTSLPGVGFFVKTSILSEESFEKEYFFKKFCADVSGRFKVIVYDDLGKISEQNIGELLDKYNLSILFIISEETAKRNGEEFYKFSIKDVIIQFSAQNENMKNISHNLTYDIIKSMNQYIEVYKNNSHDDTERGTKLLTAQISYTMIIIYIISSTPEKAFKLLDELWFLVNDSNEKNLKYIKKNIPYRYLETYLNVLINITTQEEYFKEQFMLDNLKIYIENAENYNEKAFKNQRITKEAYDDYKDIILHYKAILLYEQGNIDGAIEAVNSIRPIPINTLTKNLNLAYLYGCKKEYRVSYDYYKKVKSRKQLDKHEEVLNEVNQFINKRLDFKPNNKGIKFCSAITNCFFIDKLLGKRILDELSKEDKKIAEIYNIIQIDTQENTNK